MVAFGIRHSVFTSLAFPLVTSLCHSSGNLDRHYNLLYHPSSTTTNTLCLRHGRKPGRSDTRPSRMAMPCYPLQHGQVRVGKSSYAGYTFLSWSVAMDSLLMPLILFRSRCCKIDSCRAQTQTQAQDDPTRPDQTRPSVHERGLRGAAGWDTGVCSRPSTPPFFFEKRVYRHRYKCVFY